MVIQSKHILGNDPSTLVLDSLKGLCELNHQVALDVANKVVYVASPDPAQVALIRGGGSGHEPAHAGFVGDGVLADTFRLRKRLCFSKPKSGVELVTFCAVVSFFWMTLGHIVALQY